MFLFTEFTAQVKSAVEWLRREYVGVSTGRATPAILDLVQVESYGLWTALPHVASVTIEDPRTLRVAPWDKTQIKGIEKSLRDADLGLSVSVDDSGLRIFFPQLTTERRVQLVKIVKERLEEARVKVRLARQEAVKEIENETKQGGSEDVEKRHLEDLQKRVEEANNELESVFTKKEIEIMN